MGIVELRPVGRDELSGLGRHDVRAAAVELVVATLVVIAQIVVVAELGFVTQLALLVVVQLFAIELVEAIDVIGIFIKSFVIVVVELLVFAIVEFQHVAVVIERAIELKLQPVAFV